jgi:hypothetical protein
VTRFAASKIAAASATARSPAPTGTMHASNPYEPTVAARKAAYRDEWCTENPATDIECAAAAHAAQGGVPSHVVHVTLTVIGQEARNASLANVDVRRNWTGERQSRGAFRRCHTGLLPRSH